MDTMVWSTITEGVETSWFPQTGCGVVTKDGLDGIREMIQIGIRGGGWIIIRKINGCKGGHIVFLKKRTKIIREYRIDCLKNRLCFQETWPPICSPILWY